jgi:DNA-binding MarR family transcriptional regulator
VTVKEIQAVLLHIVRAGDDHTSRQLALLFCLREGTKTIRALAEEMNADKPVITRGVDRLVEDHYAERMRDPKDQRSVLVRLTPAGRAFVDSTTKVKVAA